MSAKKPIPPATIALQRRASDPKTSAWVSANAGSGKTHVLAQRVIRLLLEGFSPNRILCLTFTKAAAANMAERVFKTLAGWTALDDAALAEAIAATGAAPRLDDLATARKLFARAVETPGGLKIQTLHAFCERVLHVAPFEANVPAGFTVIEETEQAQLIASARRDVLLRAQHDARLGRALERIAEDAGLVFGDLLDEVLSRRALFRALAAPDAEARLRFALGLTADDAPRSARTDMLEGGIDPVRWPEIAAFLNTGSKNDQKKAALFARAHGFWRAGIEDEALDVWLEIFFTEKGEGTPAKSLATNGLRDARPDLVAELEAEQARLVTARERLNAALACERTLALGLVGNAILQRYERLKSERQLLDFEDLIARTRELFARSSAAWVLQKLDAGIDHILVDEAQDTSRAQWEILDRISEEFFAGAGQNARPRTFFAVGDEKQSIFSFQGAEPALFAKKQSDFKRRVEQAGQKFDPVTLTLSFRSAQGVLDAVDKVFENPAHFRGLSGQEDVSRTVHEALKRDAPSRVEIWDVVAPEPREEKRDWKLPVDYADEKAPAIVSARRIAETIKDWLAPESHETIMAEGRRRKIRPGDIMILVRRRDAFFEAMIRALKEKHVPVAGADRLKLAEHIAVMDLVAIGRAALLPADDLILATALKTPLFGLDDNDLMRFAPRRTGALIEALRAADDSKAQAAAAQLDLLGKMGRELPPFAFYTRLLGPRGGRKAFLARLGPEAGDALDEFLNLALAHERARPPSLPGFLAEVEGLDVSVKRDMDSSDHYVRVMTAHAAKGLEGKIVFLPDVCAAPGGHHDGRIFDIGAEDARLPVWSPGKKSDCAAVVAAREARRVGASEEYRRLLYVAMTRAEERLYIAGHRGVKAVAAESWRAMVENSLSADCLDIVAPWDSEATIKRLDRAAPELPVEPDERGEEREVFASPPWLLSPAPSELPAKPPLSPSNALEGADAAPSDAPLSPQRAQALEDGRILHRLLQFLPDVAPGLRRAAALRDLAAQAVAEERAEELLGKALRVLEDPALQPLFGANSIAEARVAARLARPDGGALDIAGAIDRLAETDDGVSIADYKTGARAEVSDAHVVQLALYRAAAALLYPGRPIRCFLIFTANAGIVEIASEKLDAALQAALFRPSRSFEKI